MKNILYITALFLICMLPTHAIDFFSKDDIISGGLALKIYDMSVITGSNAFDHEPMLAYGLRLDYLEKNDHRIGVQVFKGIQYTRENSNFDMVFGGINYQLKLNRRKDRNVLFGTVFGIGHYLIDDPSFNEQEGNFLFWEPNLDLELLLVDNFYVEMNFSYLHSFNSRFDIAGFGAGVSLLFCHKY